MGVKLRLLRDEYRLRVFENKCSEKHFDEGEEETGRWRNMHNEFHNS
jgi:hypothetical protein